MCNDNGDAFIVTLHNVMLALDICDRLFSVITLMTSGNTYLFPKQIGCCTLETRIECGYFAT